MADSYENRIQLDLHVAMVVFNPNTNSVVGIAAEDRVVADESENYAGQYSNNMTLAKDAADLEAIPGTFSGVRFMMIRVRHENMVTTPVVGTFTAKITDTDGETDQVIVGDYLLIRNKNAHITSVKLTNNEDDTSGVALPLAILMGGVN